jgi:hypothetical protein
MMTYSCSDFTGEIFEALVESGGIQKKEAKSRKLRGDDTVEEHAIFAKTAIARFEEVRDAASDFRKQVAQLLKKGKYSSDEFDRLAAADVRLKAALKAVKPKD